MKPQSAAWNKIFLKSQLRNFAAFLLLASFALVPGLSLSRAEKNPGKPHFRAADFLAPIRALASASFNGRGDGTPELDRAAAYIDRQFRKSKLLPLGDNETFLQHFTITVSAKLGEQNSFRIDRKRQGEKLTLNEDYRPFIFSSESAVSAPLVFAGYGISAPELDYDDYKGLDAQGKIVIALNHDPQESTQKSAAVRKDFGAYARIVAKVINAKNHGAVGLILVKDLGNHPDEADDLIPFGRPAGPKDAGIVALQVKSAIVNAWIKLSGKDLESLRQTIDQNFAAQSFPLDPSLVASIKTELVRIQKPVANVVGYLPGKDAASKGQCIVIGAHYDHLGRGEHYSLAPRQVGQIHYGADDNASGVSGVIQLAAQLSKQRDHLRRSIIFVAFAGEELGLLGSDYYTGHPPILLGQTVAMINLDMIGRINKNKLYVGGVGTSPGFRELLETANRDVGFDLAFSASGYGASDHTSFAKHNIPVLFFFSGLHSDYHKPSDTWDKINAPEGARVLSLVFHVVLHLDRTPERPAYVRVAEPAPRDAGGSSRGYGPYFGSIPDFGEVEHGVRFADVRDKSPAAKAGLKGGDILIEFDGKKIDNLHDFTYALQAHKPGDEITVVIIRDKEKISKKVVLEKRTE